MPFIRPWSTRGILALTIIAGLIYCLIEGISDGQKVLGPLAGLIVRELFQEAKEIRDGPIIVEPDES